MAADRQGTGPARPSGAPGSTTTRERGTRGADMGGGRSFGDGRVSSDVDALESYALGEDVPMEEGGVVAMAGWSLAAFVAVATGLAVVVGMMLLRRRRRGAARVDPVPLAAAA